MIRPDAAYNRLRKRHAQLRPEPMFDVDATPNPGPKPRARKPAERKRCPLCKALVSLDTGPLRPDLKRVLVWRPHHRKTYGGIEFLCRTSGTEYQPPTPINGDRT